MDVAELASLLGTHGVGVLATTTSHNEPMALPVSYVVLNGTPLVRTPRGSGCHAHIDTDAPVSLLVHEGTSWPALRGVTINGHAEVVDGADLAASVVEAVDTRFAEVTRRPESEAATTSAEYVVLRITASHGVTTWDNRKARA